MTKTKKGIFYHKNQPNHKKYKWMTGTRLIVIGFLLIIFLGAAILMLPFSTRGDGISFLDALFTAAYATCVTGLAVVQTNATFTIFGQVTILLLIQLGGLGFMSLTSFLYLAFSKRVKLSYRLTMREDIADSDVHHIKRLVYRIVLYTFIVESVGACILTGAFSRYMPADEAIWNGIFHSISAFCNAGLDIISVFGGGQSFMAFYSDAFVLLPISFLIILGGIGFLVISDMLDAKTWRHYRLHTKIVLCMTGALVLLGTVFYFGVEYNNDATLGGMTFGEKLLNAYFASVTARTAGFNTIDIASLKPASIILTDFLMFIGANPGSTGGGIKTTTLFILIIMVYNVIRQKKYAIVDKQTIGSNTAHKASTVYVLATFIMIISTAVLLLSDGNNFTFSELLFEQISAYATVGLSFGITPQLSVVGKLVIILNMFMGRIGVLTFFISFTHGKNEGESKIAYPECAVDI